MDRVHRSRLILVLGAGLGLLAAVIIAVVMLRPGANPRINLIDQLAEARALSAPSFSSSGQALGEKVFEENFEQTPASGWKLVIPRGDALSGLTSDYAFDGDRSFGFSDPQGGSEAILTLTVPVQPRRYYRLVVYVKARDLYKVEKGTLFEPFLATVGVQEAKREDEAFPWSGEIERFGGYLYLPENQEPIQGTSKGWQELTVFFRTEPGTHWAKLHLIFSAYSPAVGAVYFDGLSLFEINTLAGFRGMDRLPSLTGPLADYAKVWRNEGVVKRCLFTPPGTELAYRLRLPRQALLTFEPGLLVGSETLDLARIKYRVSLQSKGQKEMLFERSLDSILGTRQQIDLSPYSGKKVDLTIGVEGQTDRGGLAACAWFEPVIYSAENTADQYNLLFITLDATRTDRLGAYGFRDRPSSPRIDDLAASGVVFEDVYAQRAATVPSLTSIFTSTYPAWNGVHGSFEKLPPGMRTITQELKDRGYATGTFQYIGQTLTEGFDEYYSKSLVSFAWNFLTPSPGDDMQAFNFDQTVVDHALDWLDDHSGQPFFAWVFLMANRNVNQASELAEERFPIPDYHGPLSIEPETLHQQTAKIMAERILLKKENRDFLYAVYDSRMKATDRQVGRLLDFLNQRGLKRNTLVVIFADHGSDLYDEKLPPLYPASVFRPSLHIPLIMSLPGVVPENKRVWGLAEGIDIVPTVMEIMGSQGLPGQAQGRSLWPAVQGREWTPRPYVVSEIGASLLTIMTEEWRYIYNLAPNPEIYQWAHSFQPDTLGPETNWAVSKDDAGKFMLIMVFGWTWYAPRELYHLAGQGGETVNVLDQYPEQAAELEARLLEWDKKYRRDTAVEKLDPNAIKLLRETGYLPPR